ncbi:hypothetical protein JCM10449v2_008135 [Rhodotorula kratochvilovae]
MAEPLSTISPERLERIVHAILRPVLIGTLASNVLFGIILCLAYHYFSRFPHDRLAFKLFVGYLVVFAAVDTALSDEWTVSWSVEGFGRWTRLTSMPWQFAAFIIMTSTAVFSVQLFYGWRVWVVSQRENRVLVGVIAAFAVAMLGISVYSAYLCASLDEISDFRLIVPVMYAWLAGTCINDVLITLGMAYYLMIRPRHANAGVLKTSSRLNRLVVLSCRTNLLSALLQIVILALALGNKRSIDFMYVNMWMGKAYIASAIVTLNARAPPAPLLPSSNPPPSSASAMPSFVAGVALPHLPSSRPRSTGVDLLGFLRGQGFPRAGVARESAVQVTVSRVVIEDGDGDGGMGTLSRSSSSSTVEKAPAVAGGGSAAVEARHARIAPFASKREVRNAVEAERSGLAGGREDGDEERTVGGGL